MDFRHRGLKFDDIRSEYELLKYVLSRLTYKPNFTIQLDDRPDKHWSDWSLRIMASTVDSTTHQPTEIHHMNLIPWNARMLSDRESVIAWLRQCIKNVELHEMDEFFRLDGRMVNDPHANDSFQERKRA